MLKENLAFLWCGVIFAAQIAFWATGKQGWAAVAAGALGGLFTRMLGGSVALQTAVCFFCLVLLWLFRRRIRGGREGHHNKFTK